MVGMVCGEIFDPIGSLFYASTQSDWTPLAEEKSGLSLSQLVLEVIASKVGITFQQKRKTYQFTLLLLDIDILALPPILTVVEFIGSIF